MKQATDLLSYFHSCQSRMVAVLYQFCEINSGSQNLPGLKRMLAALTEAFQGLADETKIEQFAPVASLNSLGEVVQQQCGDALFLRKRPALERRVLLLGHMDTVYPAHHPFQQLSYIDDNQLNGPGVADMKGGLVVLLHALKAFEQSEVASKLGWDVLISADEEIGSPASRILLDELAANYQAALVYEPAMDAQGTFVKHRAGSGKLTLIATGKAAHAGRAFAKGRNAICYLAEALIAIHRLNGLKEKLSINIGRIFGGDALNVVPDKAVAQMDVRIGKKEDEHWVREEIKKIILSLEREGYSLSLHGDFNRPVKPITLATERLFSRLKAQGSELGLNFDWQDSGGCCDGNNLASHGVAVIDTLGVRGGQIHQPEEYILLDSLAERAALSTLLLIDLAQGGLEELYK